MITDMVGYTRLSQRDEALALRLLGEHNDVIRDSVASHGGREVKHTGDGFFVEFPSALQAVFCSIDIQRRLYDRNAKADETSRFQVRIGLHVGDVVHRDNDVFGDGVNITSRIEPLALPGGVCLSQSVQSQVWNKIDRPLRSLGPKELKNVDLPMEVFHVVLPWEEKEKQKAEERTKGHDRTRLAVLPLVNISQNPDDVYFADGMTEELIYTLSRIKGLRVIAQTSVMAYRGTTKTVREIGRELKVGSVLEGSVRKAGDRVRITIQLIDVSTEEHLWVERYDRELADVFEIQSEISMEVAKGLKGLLKAAVETGVVKAEALEKPTDRIDAYTEYLKGRHFWSRRTRQGLLQALEHFERAISADPGFAKAYSGIADTYSALANHGHETNEVALPKAKDAAKKALDLDPNLAEAHASLGLAYLQFKADPVKAESEFKEAIRLNPSYAAARQWYSGALHTQMRFEEALEHAQKAIDLDPMAHVMHLNAASVLSDMGRHEEARDAYARAVELEPDYEGSHGDLAQADMALWNWCGAEETLSRALERNPNNTEALVTQAMLKAVVGKREEALVSARKALAIAPDSYHVVDQAAQVLRSLGEAEEAIGLFEGLRRAETVKPWTTVMLAFAYLDIGRNDDARRVLSEEEENAKALMPWTGFWFSTLHGILAAAAGDKPEARRRIEEVEGCDRLISHHTAKAMILFRLGDEDGAYASLEEGLAVHDPLLVNLPVDPFFDAHRSDPRFQRILEVMGLAKVAKAA
jgi:adenylate cyclase